MQMRLKPVLNRNAQPKMFLANSVPKIFSFDLFHSCNAKYYTHKMTQNLHSLADYYYNSTQVHERTQALLLRYKLQCCSKLQKVSFVFMRQRYCCSACKSLHEISNTVTFGIKCSENFHLYCYLHINFQKALQFRILWILFF